ncbi:MAG: BON domain-containing protein [Nitrospirae bacterium]|nr:BON domain-containing protein [Nitrospirota bacterium]
MNIKAIYRITLMAAAVFLLTAAVSLFASETDDRIESAARGSYVFKVYLKDDDISVRSSDGVVTLKGSVSEESHRSLAEETVTGLPGVKGVDNRLEVKGERPARDSDAWLTAKVKSVLLFHRNVSAVKTGVRIKDGIVTLRGEASSEAQKELTTEYVKDVEGVKDVRNEMTVTETQEKSSETPGEKIDDVSITVQVKMALLLHRSTSALKTKVETDNGVVKLEGMAKNPAEKDLVTKLVSDIHGVRKVQNRMTVEGDR